MVNVSENCYSTGSTFTSNALAASLQQAPGEAPGPYAPPGASTVRRRRRRDNDPAFTTTRRAVVEVPRHLRGKQPATCSARSAMKRFRQVIGLMHVTPYRSSLARPAQMHGVMDTAPAHLTPVAIADCAHFATTVADNDGTVWRMFPVTHLPPSSLSCTSSCSHSTGLCKNNNQEDY
jgi:hypothetical protein